MPTYMTQFSYTADAWAKLAKNPEDRGAAVKRLVESLGGQLRSIYYSMGDYDGLIIVDLPDGKTTATAILAAAIAGHLKITKTTELFSMQEMMEIAGNAGSQVYSAPKG